MLHENNNFFCINSNLIVNYRGYKVENQFDFQS